MTASPRNEVARARRAAESVLALTSIALVAVCADACGKDEAKGTASNGGGAVTTTTTTTTGTGTGTTTGGHGGAGQGGATTTGQGGGQTTGQGGGQTTTTSTFTTTSSSTGDASLPPACTVGSKWSVVVGPAAVGTPDDDLMGSITPDELHIAWMTPDGAVRYADRVGPGMVFAGYQTLPATPGYFAVDRVALGAGGLELVAVTTSRKGFGVFSRQDPMGAFAGPPDSAPFAAIAAALGPNEQLGDPVIAPDGKTLFYSVFGAAPTTIKVATRSDPKQAWAPAGALDAPELQAVGNARRRPTGISSDLRTLFFWDETKSTELAAWRPSPGAPFDTFLDIGPLFGATPGANCVGLYYSGWGVAPPPLPDGGILDGGLIPADAAPPLDSGSDAMPPPPDAAPPPPTLPPPPPPPNGEGDGPRDIFHAFPQ